MYNNLLHKIKENFSKTHLFQHTKYVTVEILLMFINKLFGQDFLISTEPSFMFNNYFFLKKYFVTQFLTNSITPFIVFILCFLIYFRFGRKPVAMGLIFFVGLSAVVAPFAPNYVVFVLIRLVCGACGMGLVQTAFVICMFIY